MEEAQQPLMLLLPAAAPVEEKKTLICKRKALGLWVMCILIESAQSGSDYCAQRSARPTNRRTIVRETLKAPKVALNTMEKAVCF